MKNLFRLILLLLFCACSSSSPVLEIDSSGAKKITLKFEFDNVNVMSLIDSIEYIPLETTSESIIGKIDKIIYKYDKYYIFDEQQHIVLIFDSKGHYLSKIAKKGQGPDEYTKIYDMQIDNDGNVDILPASKEAKIIKYNKSGNQSIFIPNMQGDQFIHLNDGYLFYSATGNILKNNRFYLYSTDENGKVINKWLPAPIHYGGYLGSYKIFDAIHDTVLFAMPFDNNIYQIVQNGQQTKLSVRYILDYGKEFPQSFKDMFYNDDDNFNQYADEYVLGTSVWYETDKLLFLEYHRNNNIYYALFDKIHNTLKVVKPNDVLTYALFEPSFTINNVFISAVDISKFNFDEYTGNKDYFAEKYPELIRTYSLYNMSSSSNPLLIKYKFK